MNAIPLRVELPADVMSTIRREELKRRWRECRRAVEAARQQLDRAKGVSLRSYWTGRLERAERQMEEVGEEFLNACREVRL